MGKPVEWNDRETLGVSFTDANTGTAVGYSGTILRTTDGGDTWNSQSTGSTVDLWDVCFTDGNTGTVVGDNGTILRTTDGGTTWASRASGVTTLLYGVSFTGADHGNGGRADLGPFFARRMVVRPGWLG